MSCGDTGSGDGTYGSLVLRGAVGMISISKELFDGVGCITFDNGVREDTEVSGGWSTELLEKYFELCKLRRAMNFFFFMDGIMKDDVREVSEALRDVLDFSELFELCETLKDVGMAYYASYFIEIKFSTPVGEHVLPLIYLRHHDGTYYSDLIGTMLGDEDMADGEERFSDTLHLINVGKFDFELYRNFCKLRVKHNGKLYADTKHVIPDVYETMSKYSDEALGAALDFANYIGDLTTEPDKVMEHPYHYYANCIGCVIGTQFQKLTEFTDLNEYLIAINKPPTHLFKPGGKGGAGGGDDSMEGDGEEEAVMA